MKQLLKKYLIGDIPVREYATVTIQGAIHEKVFLIIGNKRKEISEQQWLLCLKPVVFGIWFPASESASINEKAVYQLKFFDSPAHATSVATISLHYLERMNDSEGTLLLLKLSSVSSHHIGFIKTRFLFHRHYKKPGQDFKTLKSYAAAYSYPRKVRLISFKEENHYNIFPMDLVGDIPQSSKYVFGLRHTNISLPRIIETGKIAVAEIPFQYKDIIYQLGKHHRGPLTGAVQSMEFIQTQKFQFPFPDWINSYKEIQITSAKDLGSHMLLWGQELGEETISHPSGHLFHIHFLHFLHQHKKGMAYPLV